MFNRKYWNVNKLVVLALIGGMAMLLLEIRSDHRDVLGEQTLAWAPIFYTGAMLVVGAIGLAMWDRGGRHALMLGFIISMFVGLLGFYLHNRRHPVERVAAILAAWEAPIRHEDEGRGRRRPEGASGQPERANTSAGRVAQAAPTARGDEDEHGEAAENPREQGEEGERRGDVQRAKSGESTEQRPPNPVRGGGGVDLGTTPPVLAPLSFVGLGLIGALACANGMQQAATRQAGA